MALFAATSAVYWYDVHRWRRENEDEPPDFLVTLGNDVVERTRWEERETEEERDESGPNDADD